MTRMTWAILQSISRESLSEAAAWGAVDTLGWLSPWWLRPVAIELAARRQPAFRAYQQRPALPCEPGGCWVVFVNPRRSELLRDAFLLPLRWQRGEDDPHLPRSLARLAERVRGQFPDAASSKWGLSLSRPSSEEVIDLSHLDGEVGVESAWAALAGGLQLARDGLTPDAGVWASVAWDEVYGVGRVDGLQAKLNLALEWDARRIFVPAQNQPDVDDWKRAPAGKLQVSLLAPVSSSATPRAARLLQPYLEELGTEPGPEHDEELQRRYHALVSRGTANDFYWRGLLSPAVYRCRAAINPECRPTHLVTGVGLERSIVAMAPLALGVRHCLLLCTDLKNPRLSEVLDKVKDRLQKGGARCVVRELASGERDVELASARKHLREFAEGVPPDQVAFDLTPAFKPLTLALEAVAPVNSWLLYCRHEQQGEDQRIRPGTERYDCWRKQ
ncbi:MAG: hypothetical protein U0840_12360 [Gemmataceae bacterium]